MVAALREARPDSLRGEVVRVLGAGGTARIAAYALQAAGAGVELCARRDDVAGALAIKLGISARPWADRAAAATVVINTTPLGMQPDDPLPLKPAAVPGLRAVLDAVYTPPTTAWVHAAEAAGVRAISGVRMFLHQAHAQQRLWAEARADDLPAPAFADIEAAWESLT